MTARRRWPIAGLVLLLAGCAEAPSALDPHAPEARHIAGLWWLMLGLAAAVFVIVIGFVVVAMWRRRHEAPDEVIETAAQRRLLVIGGLVVPALILAVVAVATVRTTNALPTGSGAVAIHVEGERWWWRVTYPDLGVVTANEIHVPVGEQVDITLTSDNVIHSLWVPQLNGKADLIPGQTNHLRFTANEAGTYRGQCAEFCGIEHARMARRSWSPEPPAEFAAWARAAGPAGGDAVERRRPSRREPADDGQLRRMPHASPAPRPAGPAVPTSRTSPAGQRSPPARCRTRRRTCTVGWPQPKTSSRAR